MRNWWVSTPHLYTHLKTVVLYLVCAVQPARPPAVVIAATATGFGCTLQFDRPITLLSTSPDDAILFDGLPAFGVNNYAPDLLGFECAQFLGSGSTWEIVRQPAWVVTGVAQPVSGVYA